MKQLYELQKVDLEMATIRKSLADVAADLADNSKVTETKTRIDLLQTNLDNLSSERRAVERTLNGLRDTIDNLEQRLYGGTITNPQQLAATEEERTFNTQLHAENEDKVLALMVQIDECEENITDVNNTLLDLETERPLQEASLLESQSGFSKQLESLDIIRKSILPKIPSNVMPLYESLRKKKGGMAVAEVKRDMCQGCRLVLPTMELQRARNTQSIVQCSSCSRILYSE